MTATHGWVGVALVLAAACTPPPPGKEDAGEPAPAWHVALEAEAPGGTLQSVWGSAPDNVFAVGGSLGNGGETLVIHHDGSTLKRLHPGGTETLWWVGGRDATDVWMVGEHGRALRFDGTAFHEQPTGLDVTLWGVWVDAPGSAWVVGGSPGQGALGINDLVLHFHDGAYERITLPGAARNVSLFKVWGAQANNFYVVGESGTIWHSKDGAWLNESPVQPPPLGTLFTVSGCSASEVYAVGGRTLLRSDGSAWTPVSVAGLMAANGVTCAGGVVTVVGFGGLKLRDTGNGFVDQSFDAPFQDMHAAWADGAGNTWAVGGDWLSPPRPGVAREGLLARFGARAPPTQLTP